MERAEIQHRIEELKKKRDAFVRDANLQAANLNGQIQGLEDLIKPKAEAPAQEAPSDQP